MAIVSRGKNRGNARIIMESQAAYENMRRNGRFEDEIKWYIHLYRESRGQNNSWKAGSLRVGGKVYEAHLTIKEAGL
jgi:hypothetical protein